MYLHANYTHCSRNYAKYKLIWSYTYFNERTRKIERAYYLYYNNLDDMHTFIKNHLYNETTWIYGEI
jgi:hypothetical protein